MILDYCTSSMESSIFNSQSNYNQKVVDAHRMKHNLTLNLENFDNCTRRSKYNIVVNSPAPLLSSPDVNKFKLSTPDIMKLFPGINQKTTSSPSGNSIFVRSVNQDDYSQTFESLTSVQYDPSSLQVDSLKSEVYSRNPANDPLSDHFINIENRFPLPSVNTIMVPDNMAIKEEPLAISSLASSPRLSPIDMDTQEAIKLERKRSRNRLAASKCRKRKLERIAKLEDKVKLLKGENNELNQLLSRLKAQVYNLKQKVVKHYSNGCLIGQQ